LVFIKREKKREKKGKINKKKPTWDYEKISFLEKSPGTHAERETQQI
jgi:hypothetical protein